MEVRKTDLPEVLVVQPRVFGDDRGYFLEVHQRDRYAGHGIGPDFVQDNLSRSSRGVLRGLHFQEPQAQGKLVQVVRGQVYDVAIDVRRGGPRFGRWTGVELSAENHWQLWVPAGFAHGFLVLSDVADVSYKCTAYYAPGCERTIRWDDPDIGIAWPDLGAAPVVSDKDARGTTLAEAPVLPDYRG